MDGDAAFERLHDHLVLLDQGEAVDLIVVGEGVVVDRQEAERRGLAKFAEGLEPEVAVEEEEGHDYEPLTEEEMRKAIEQEAPKPTQQAKPKKPKAKKG